MARSAFPAQSYDVADVGALIGDPSRAAMLLALLDDVARPAGELARLAGVGAPTASAHLVKLVAGGIVAVERQGRHRYYRLARAEVALALEALALVRPLRRVQARLDGDPARRALAQARLCYRHLAGRLGVTLTDALVREGWLRRDGARLVITRAGGPRLDALGLDGARPVGKACLDWTERRPHLGGALGVAWTQLLVAQGYIKRAGDGRAVRLTDAGRRRLARELSVDELG